jgi:DNA-binding beta-propeller fold protein YncE
MHIDSYEETLFVPLYGNDMVARISGAAFRALTINDSLDAPAGVSVRGKEYAIADFYNHRILYASDGTNFLSFGTEGKAGGQFYYPTDVQITESHIWVADAYNNRVQVFTKDGQPVRTIGEAQKMNAATGIFVGEHELFVTDFENNRILVFNHEGELLQTIAEGVEKPTDVLVRDGKLYIANYKSGNLQIFSKN